VCYNCSKNGHFIAQHPYERKEEDNEKKKKLDKSYKKEKEIYKEETIWSSSCWSRIELK
jgi:hypothetical protein